METRTFTGIDGLELAGYVWRPEGEPKAVLQIAHGMAEHAKRYDRVARTFTDAGWLVAAHDHRGHGASIRKGDPPGHMADEGAWGKAVDDLHRVADLDLSNATVEAIMEGIDLVERKFVRTLEDSAVEMIDPTGQTFDPERMEAMMRVPAESDEQVDTVAQVFQKGYSLKGILVRPARVSVYTQG